MDLPGHGANASVPFTWDAALAQLDALIILAGDAPLVLAGDSLGGYLVLAAAAHSHARPSGVVAGGCTYALRGLGGLLARASDLPVRALTAVFGEAALARMFAIIFARMSRDRALAVRVAETGLRVRSRTESLRELYGRDVLAWVRAIDVPVTFINGARDIPIVWSTRAYARAARYGRAVIVPATPHAVSVLQPDAFAAEIMRCFERAC